MSRRTNIAHNYTISLLKLQQSIDNLFETTIGLNKAIEDLTIEEGEKVIAYKQTIATVSTIIEIQKSLAKKISVLLNEWNIQGKCPTHFPQLNMKKYHKKKEYFYHTVIYRAYSPPTKPWKANLNQKNRRV